MKRKNVFSILTALLCVCAQASESVVITNPSPQKRVDEAFVIKRSQLKSPNKLLLPALKNSAGSYIPSQADDLDGDGYWDELAFVYSLSSMASATFKIEWVKAEKYPTFKPRTNVRYGKMIAPHDIRILPTDMHDNIPLPNGWKNYPYQTDGPAWENDKVGFRHYFDGRNVRDVFGKLVPDMVLDTVGIMPNGRPGDTYHVMRKWGRDIMSGARSFGLGGIALQMPDTLVRLGVTADRRTDNIDSTRYTRVVNGPVRSIFKLDFYGWDVCGKKVDVHETMTIWAGKYGYENSICTTELPSNSCLVTGIVNNFNDRPYIREMMGDFELMATHDKQTYDKVWYLGMAVLIDKDNYTNQFFDAPKSGKGITTTWCTPLKENKQGEYRFNCYAGWELSEQRFTDVAYFVELIRSYAYELTLPSTVMIK